VGNGAALWLENCAPCHGSGGRGDGETAQASGLQVPDLTDVEPARTRSLAAMFEVIKNGRIERLMPPWGNRLNDQEIWDVTAYVWNLSVPKADLQAGQAVYDTACLACHGETGRGDGPQATETIPDLTNLAAIAGKSQADWRASLDLTSSTVHAGPADLSDEALWQALAFARSQAFSFPARDGTLRAQLTNETVGRPQGDLPVTLHAFHGDVEVETSVNPANSRGEVTFSDLDTDPSLVYVLETVYEGVPYVNGLGVSFGPDQDEIVAPLALYETTDADGTIVISQLNQLMRFGPGGLEVLQVQQFSNRGDRSFIGTQGDDGLPMTVGFQVPEAAIEVTVHDEAGAASYRKLNGVYVSQNPLQGGGGEAVAVVSYLVPASGDALNYEIPVLYDVEVLNILVADQDITVDSDQVQLIDQQDVQGETFNFYHGGSLPASQYLRLRFSRLSALASGSGPVTAPPNLLEPGRSQQLVLWSILGLGLLTTGLGILYPRLRSQVVADEEPESLPDMMVARDRLVYTIARLDGAYRRRELDRHVYEPARTRYKARLSDVLRQITLAEDELEIKTR
jgi:mono/diheme cytochrome c family protein